MTQHPLITQWAIDKFKLDPASTVRIEQETQYHGYCETCSYETEAWIVYAKKAGEKKEVQVHQFDDDFASLLREVLDYAMAKGTKT